jgi:hypothetical protein
MRLVRSSLIALLLVSFAAPAAADSRYPLDAISRDVPAHAAFACPTVDLERYSGTVIPFREPVRIYVGFEEHLRAFEEIVRATAVEVYGRAPRVLVHDGAYLCRRVRRIADLLSEHALGNAIDVEGFDFGPAPDGAGPPAWHGSFSVRLDRDWGATAGPHALHAHFLHLVAERVIAAEIFRVVLGPSYPGHEGHLHLDLAPYRLVHVFGFDPAHSSSI